MLFKTFAQNKRKFKKFQNNAAQHRENKFQNCHSKQTNFRSTYYITYLTLSREFIQGSYPGNYPGNWIVIIIQNEESSKLSLKTKLNSKSFNINSKTMSLSTVKTNSKNFRSKQTHFRSTYYITYLTLSREFIQGIIQGSYPGNYPGKGIHPPIHPLSGYPGIIQGRVYRPV